jgi:hypothetical protein
VPYGGHSTKVTDTSEKKKEGAKRVYVLRLQSSLLWGTKKEKEKKRQRKEKNNEPLLPDVSTLFIRLSEWKSLSRSSRLFYTTGIVKIIEKQNRAKMSFYLCLSIKQFTILNFVDYKII